MLNQYTDDRAKVFAEPTCLFVFQPLMTMSVRFVYTFPAIDFPVKSKTQPGISILLFPLFVNDLSNALEY